MKIKKGDTVKILVGKDQGKSGVVDFVFPSENKVVVKGIQVVKKHLKPSKKNPSGGIIDLNQKINSSNIMLICPTCGVPTKIGYNLTNEAKVRICKKCKKSVEKIKS